MCRLLLLLLIPSVSHVLAQDWIQWGGDERQFVRPADSAIAEANDFEVAWRIPIGAGNSSVVLRDDLGSVSFSDGEREHVVAFSLEDGALRWQRSFDFAARDFMDFEFGVGPHSTPLIAGNVVVSIGSTGRISAMSLNDGSLQWQRELWAGDAFTRLERGFASSPIAFGDTVIVAAGGRDCSVRCLSLSDGEIRWAKHDFAASYASPCLGRLCGRVQLIQLMDQNLIALDPATGALLWKHPVPTENYVNCTSPVVGQNDRVFINTSEGLKSLRVERRGTGFVVNEDWSSRVTIAQTSNFIVLDDILYGSKEGGVFVALDVTSGRTLWQRRDLRSCSVAAAGNRVFAVQENGAVVIVTATRGGIQRVWKRDDLLRGRCWAGPSLTGNSVLIRDSNQILKLQPRSKG